MLIGLGQTFMDFSKEVKVEYRATYSAGGNTSFRSFTSVDIGAASPERIVVVTTAGYRSTSFTNTVTINGITATQIVSGGALDSSAIYAARVPTGENVTVAVNSSTNVDTLRIYTYAIYGLDTLTVLSSGNTEVTSGNPSVSVSNTKSNSVLIYLGSNRSTSGFFTFSGVATGKNSEDLANAVDMATGSSIVGNISGTLTSTYSGSTSYHKIAYAIFGT